MTEKLNPHIVDLGSTRLTLRGDVTFTPHSFEGGREAAIGESKTGYLVEDSLNSRFFRLGFAEYTFVSLLDGKTTIQQALSRISSVAPDHQLNESDAASLACWLVEMDLAHTAESSQACRLERRAKQVEKRKTLNAWNPLVMRVSLGCPDSLLAWLAHGIGWLYSLGAFFVWLLFVVIGAYQIWSQFDRFAAAGRGFFGPQNWLALMVCWIVLKLLHEVSHGVVCKRYGAAVREAGLLFILFVPLAYVDVTSSWRLRSKAQRMHVAAAGMYIELFIAALAAMLWSNTTDPWLGHICYNLIAMSGVASIAFNANPLMKFDGYYILSDALGIPNLYVNGQQYLRYWGRKYLLGAPAALPHWPGKKGLIIKVYGIASFVWRWTVCIGLVIAAGVMFHGAGWTLAGVAVAFWLGPPLWGFLKFFLVGAPGVKPRRLRILLMGGAGIGAAVACLALTPWPGAHVAPAVVEFAPFTTLRAGVSGFVREVYIEGGQQVTAGQLLAVIENRELSNEVADLQLVIEQSLITGRQHEQQQNLASWQAEAKKREALTIELTEKRAQLKHLEVRAPRDGRIIGRRLGSLIGVYLKKGDEILSLGADQNKELRVSIPQDDVEVFNQRVGKPLHVRFPGVQPFPATLSRVIPRASLQLEYPALSAANGGYLPVREAATGGDSDSQQENTELLSPHFTGVIRLDPTRSDLLSAGQLGTVRHRPFEQSLGAYLFKRLSKWIRRRVGQG